MVFGLVRAVHAVVVAVAQVDARDAVAVVASEERAEAGALLALALVRLVSVISAVVVAVTVPGGRDAAVVVAPVAQCRDWEYEVSRKSPHAETALRDNEMRDCSLSVLIITRMVIPACTLSAFS